MRTAIITEWLETYAGAELVIEQMLKVLPGTEMYTLVDFLPEDQRDFLQGCRVFSSFIQNLPFARRKFRASTADAAGSRAVRPDRLRRDHQFESRRGQRRANARGSIAHLLRSHARAVRLGFISSVAKSARACRGPKSWMTRLILHYLRLWDHATAARVDAFAANSHYVARRIWKTYRRRAKVIYPPVDISRFAVQHQKDDTYVTISRLVPYKRVDLMIEAFRRMPRKQLIVIGDGPERAILASGTPPNVKVLGRQPADVVTQHLQSARAFVFAADEDFGISPVEAQACGTPVIAYGHGGTAETVRDGVTGILYPHQSADSIVLAVEAFERRVQAFDPSLIRTHAEQFSVERFRKRFARFVERCLSRRDAPSAPAQCAVNRKDDAEWLWRGMRKRQLRTVGREVST